jgi:subtilase family serine protease
MRSPRVLLPSFIALVLLCSTAAVAQKIASNVRIIDKVDENQLVTLRGNVHPAAIAQNDLGRVSSEFPMSDLILVLSRSQDQQAAFDAFVASQYDSTSSNFHHWLQPAEIGEKFGPSLADIATVTSWLAGHGLTVQEVSKDRMTIRFGGSARQVEATFHTQIHNLNYKGEHHIGNMTDPQIPMALEQVVFGVKALHNFNPRPLHRLGGKAMLNSSTGRWEQTESPFSVTRSLDVARAGASSKSTAPHADLGITTGSGTSTQITEDVTPYDFATIYNVLPLWNATTPIDGTGQTIAVAGTSRISLADVASFRSLFGLPAGSPPQEILGNSIDPGQCTAASTNCTLDDQIENALDVEWSGAVAKGAQIVLITSGLNAGQTNDPVFDSANFAVQNNTAKILNVSYGLCELFLGTGGNTTYHNLWQTAASAGIAVFTATGDSGSPSCDQGGSNSAGTPYGAQFGLTVSGLASTPYNTAVGGTDFNWGATASPFWGATNSSANGSNALGYIPEIPWNSSCSNPVAVASINAQLKESLTATQICDQIATGQIISNTNEASLEALVDSVGASGGESNCTSSNGAAVGTCTGGYSTPSWQTGVTGIPTDGKRYIPDVSFFASNGFLGSSYLVCVSATGACLTTTSPTTEPLAQEIGGTSASSPAMAGVMALINQKAGTPQGNPNSELYSLASKQTYASCKSETVTNSSSCYFNDVDTGTIAMACAGVPLSPNCTVTTSGDQIGLLTGYSAVAGFDLATGLGSLNVANVVNGFVPTIGTTTSTVTVVPAQSTIISNIPLTVTGTVTGTAGTPTGAVVLTGGGYSSPATALASGAYSITIPGNSLSAGSDTLTVTYGGDPTYAISSASAPVTVTQFVGAVANVTVSPASSAIESGNSLVVTGTVSGGSGTPTGTVTLGGGGFTTPSPVALTAGAYSITIPANSLSAGSDTLTVAYSGDLVYATGQNSAIVTVTPSVFTLAATAPPAVNRGSSATSTITASSTTGYSGTVVLTCTLNAGGPANTAADAPTCTIPPSSVAIGATATATVATKASSTTASLAIPAIRGKGTGWAGGGAVLALLVFLGIPARRRSWRAMLGVLVLMLALGSLAACGGSGGGGGGGTTDPGTASGAYTFTVTGTGTPALTSKPTTTFTVTVN